MKVTDSVARRARPGFSLVELIVVVGIIAILAGVLIASFAGGTETARAAKCLANMRNLASAWQGGRAGSQEHLSIVLNLGGNNAVGRYTEAKGWVSSATQGLYPSDSHQTFAPIGMYETDQKRIDFAITNGWMYAAIGRDLGAFTCPAHAKKRTGKGRRPAWSYLMSAYFGWDSSSSGNAFVTDGCIYKPDLSNAERLLIFAEVPFQGVGSWFPDGTAGTMETDGILQYKGCDESKKSPTINGASKGGNENIGGNHKVAKRWCAHVAFADGHTEKLVVDGISSGNLIELTTWLCTGVPVARAGNDWKELK